VKGHELWEAVAESVDVDGHPKVGRVSVPLHTETFDYTRLWDDPQEAVDAWCAEFLGERRMTLFEEGGTYDDWRSLGYEVTWDVPARGVYVAFQVDVVELPSGRWAISGALAITDPLER
jgi:hypothetical protein